MTNHLRHDGRAAATPMDYLAGLATLLGCQLAGEILVHAIHSYSPAFVFPGPVAGMLLLLCLLLRRRAVTTGIETAASGLIGILSLLFVPSAVGIVQYGDTLLTWGVSLILAVVVSTLATLLVTVGTFVFIARVITGRPS